MSSPLVFLLLGTLFLQANAVSQFSTVFKWINVEYGFPTPADKQRAIDSGLYDPKPFRRIGDVDVDYIYRKKPRIFVSTPRLIPGVPYSLATISDEFGPNGPLLQPYPDLKWHLSNGADCDGITSVYRFFIDKCGRLWALDFGIIGRNLVCPFKILIFDLKTDKLLRRFTFPSDQYYPDSSAFSAIVVDVVAQQCSRAKAYVVDARGYGLLVYDLKTDRSWRVEHELFKADPTKETMSIAGESFTFPDGLYTVALSPDTDKKRYIYFHALTSYKKSRCPLNIINYEAIWKDDRNAFPELFETYGTVEGVHAATSAMDSAGNLYTGLVEPISIVSWNTTSPFVPANVKVVANDQKALQFVSGMKTVRNRYGEEELWVVTVRLQKIQTGSINYDEVNFRVLACGTKQMKNNQNCKIYLGK